MGGACLIDGGKVFQYLGAAMLKAKFPLHLSLDLGIQSRSWLEDWRNLVGGFMGACIINNVVIVLYNIQFLAQTNHFSS